MLTQPFEVVAADFGLSAQEAWDALRRYAALPRATLSPEQRRVVVEERQEVYRRALAIGIAKGSARSVEVASKLDDQYIRLYGLDRDSDSLAAIAGAQQQLAQNQAAQLVLAVHASLNRSGLSPDQVMSTLMGVREAIAPNQPNTLPAPDQVLAITSVLQQSAPKRKRGRPRKQVVL